MPTFEFSSPEGKKYHVDGPEGATAAQAWDVLQAQEIAAEKGMKFEPLTKTRGEYLSEIPGKVAESLLPLSATGPSDQAKQEFHHWQEDQLKATGYAPFAPWEHGGNPVLGAAELGATLPLGAGAKAAAAGASKVLPAMAGTFFKGRPVPYGFWSDAEAVNLIRKRIEEGATRREIHEEFGQGALDVMKRLGIGTGRRRGRPSPSQEEMETISRLIEEGKTWREIGEAVGKTDNVRSLAARHGLPFKEDAFGAAPQVSKWVTDAAAGVKSRVSSSDPQALMRALQASQRPKSDPLKAGGPLASPDDVLEKRAVSAGGKKAMPETLERDVLERGRSGRPVTTSPLATGTEDAILQRGFDRNAVFAYHASPHDFDKFDLSKMGTGQGAQSYGAGHYLAESPEVSGRGGAYDQEFSSKLRHDLYPPKRIAGEFLEEAKGDRDAAYRNAIDAARTYQGAPRGKWYVEAAEFIEKGWEPPKAKIYETVIKSPPEKFIDYDVPFNEQPQHVKDAIRAAGSGLKPDVKMSMDGVLSDLRDDVRYKLMQENKRRFDAGEMSQADYNRANQELHNANGKKLVSQELAKAGIPGIKYLDEQSRNFKPGARVVSTEEAQKLRPDMKSYKYFNYPFYVVDDTGGLAGYNTEAEARAALPPSKQTRNFVVFDDKTIDVLKKYAAPGLATGGGAAAALQAGGDDPLAK